MSEGTAVDPVCGKQVDILRARAVGIFGGVTFYFCSADCKARFVDPRKIEREPERVAAPRPRSAERRVVVDPAPSSPIEAVAPEPSRHRRVIVAAAVVVVLGLGALIAVSRSGPPEAARSTPPTASPPVAALRPPVDLGRAVDASTPAAPRTVVELQPPLRLGLRRFVDRHDGKTIVTAWLLAIDATGHGSPFEVARLELPDDEAPDGIAADAIQPRAEFAAATAAMGTIFDDVLVVGVRHLDVRVTRRRTGVLVETRTGVGNEGAFRERMELALPESGVVRGAAFAKRRYLPDQPDKPSEKPPVRSIDEAR